MEKALLAQDAENLIRRIVDVFQKTMNLWEAKGHSIYGIKDRKEFTSMMIDLARKSLINKEEIEIPITEKQPDYMEGQLLVVNYDNERWFGFIKTCNFSENIYFDSRNFSGEIRHLIPKTKVRFVVKTRNHKGKEMLYADDVVIVK